MMNVRKQQIRQRRIKTLLLMGAALVVIIFFYFNQAKNNILSSDVKKRLDFNVIVPAQDSSFSGYSLNKNSFKVVKDNEENIFSYELFKGSEKITITQQIYPDILIYDKLTNSIKPYAEVNTINGTVTLGRPEGAKGRQVAVARPKNLLIFAYSSRDLSNGEWRSVFNSLESIR